MIISGILTAGDGHTINGTIVFTAKKTTSKVIENTQVIIDVANGNYSVDLLPCDYDVILMIDGHSKNRLGSIRVLADSRNGSLNDYLLNPAESEVTPALLQQFSEYRDSAKKSEENAKKFAETIDISRLVKKSGDTMTGNLSVKDKISILNKDRSGLILHAQENTNNVLFIFMNKDGKSDYKMAYNQERNSIEFRGLDDVKINSKSVLKTGDAMRLFGNLAETSINKLNGLSDGFYFQNANKLATSQNGYPINEAGDLQVIQNGAEGSAGCSQIYTTYRNARQFIRNYRCTAKTWEPWVEVITTANINQILPVGIPMPWPSVTPPDGWLICNGWKFDKSLYPGLAAAYPSGYLPEMRATTIRGLDAGRGIDVGRAILSEQGDAMRNLTGTFGFESNIGGNTGGADISGVFYSVPDPRKHVKGGTEDGNSLVKMDASRQVPTANEFRVRSIAFLYIVRAA